jgi:hypothetical protein
MLLSTCSLSATESNSSKMNTSGILPTKYSPPTVLNNVLLAAVLF